MFLASKVRKLKRFVVGCCFILLVAACGSADLVQNESAAGEISPEENNVSDPTPRANEDQTIQSNGESEENTPTAESGGTVSIESGVELPFSEPLDLPYSEWGEARSQELLTANGFGASVDEWRRALGHSSGLVRESATYLLVRQPDPEDEGLLRNGLNDIDESVKALSAYGLIRLGDDSARSTLLQIAKQDPDIFLSAPLAAGLLAELGDPSAFDTMIQAMANEFGYVRLIAMQNMASFIPLHGQITGSSQAVDIWSLYCQALGDEDGQVSAIARMQLEESDLPEAKAALKDCANN